MSRARVTLSEPCMQLISASEPDCCSRWTSEVKLPASWAPTSTKLTFTPAALRPLAAVLHAS